MTADARYLCFLSKIWANFPGCVWTVCPTTINGVDKNCHAANRGKIINTCVHSIICLRPMRRSRVCAPPRFLVHSCTPTLAALKCNTFTHTSPDIAFIVSSAEIIAITVRWAEMARFLARDDSVTPSRVSTAVNNRHRWNQAAPPSFHAPRTKSSCG